MASKPYAELGEVVKPRKGFDVNTAVRVKTTEAAQGRWDEILLALGLPAKLLNRKNQPCPRCGGHDRFRYTDYGQQGTYYCSQCGTGNGIKLLGMIHGWDWQRALNEVDRVIGNLPRRENDSSASFYHTKAATPSSCRRLYEASLMIEPSCPVDLYLMSRGMMPDDYAGMRKAIRYVPEMRYQADHSLHPGMIAIFSDQDGHAATIHRTYLTATGRKAALAPNKMFLPGHVPLGGAIRLNAPGEDLTCIGIAEGIETALACRALRSGLPVWAATGDSLLKAWVPPKEALEITIFGDNDESYAGQAAAYALAKRLKMEAQRDGIARRIYVEIPTKVGDDFNNVLFGGDTCAH